MKSTNAAYAVDRIDDYLFEGDEAFHVIEGAATIQLPETDETVEVRAGDVVYLSAGTRSVWTITETFKKFTVIDS
ncbi:MAG TPA: cupin domain-containing protein [Solirubrobacterales bacterium]|jgi:uncharacterized protein|nr:cupin domain-containing protein [Solirubrobacterales bacterium]